MVEVHSEEEAAVAEAIGADFIGINNRDLSTFHTDLGTTARVIASISGQTLVISESALSRREDVDAVTRAGVRG
ncbi:MAG: indole-3-glycerol-phosphate synthase TrpC, partial [Armatimonadota bacterium]